MTKQESFKARIRARMEKTGEKYAAARRALIDKSATADRTRSWVAEPEMSNDKVLEATGKGWDEWCDLIEEWGGHDRGHTAIATHLRDELGVDAWWSQAVTVGFERITGLRLPHQMADGTFTANKSKTVSGDAETIRELLLSDDGRSHLFPGHGTELRSRSDAKSLRLAIGPGVALFALDPKPDGRVTVTVAHERLPSFDDVEEWKFYWTEWLEALGDG